MRALIIISVIVLILSIGGLILFKWLNPAMEWTEFISKSGWVIIFIIGAWVTLRIGVEKYK